MTKVTKQPVKKATTSKSTNSKAKVTATKKTAEVKELPFLEQHFGKTTIANNGKLTPHMRVALAEYMKQLRSSRSYLEKALKNTFIYGKRAGVCNDTEYSRYLNSMGVKPCFDTTQNEILWAIFEGCISLFDNIKAAKPNTDWYGNVKELHADESLTFTIYSNLRMDIMRNTRISPEYAEYIIGLVNEAFDVSLLYLPVKNKKPLAGYETENFTKAKKAVVDLLNVYMPLWIAESRIKWPQDQAKTEAEAKESLKGSVLSEHGSRMEEMVEQYMAKGGSLTDLIKRGHNS